MYIQLILLGLLSLLGTGHGNVCAKGNDYMCLDWTLGSKRMSDAQAVYNNLNNDKAVFGVGSFGPDETNFGKCYRIQLNTQRSSGYSMIIQVTNNGQDIKSGQFDVQMGAGGFGVYNACAYRTDRTDDPTNPCPRGKTRSSLNVEPLFFSPQSKWGARCGGIRNSASCSSLPPYPRLRRPSQFESEPTLNEMCRRAFRWQIRGANGENPTFQNGRRVPCPPQLYRITGLKRRDDNNPTERIASGKVTSTMDCCAPAASYRSKNKRADPRWPRVTPCKPDGYTRVG